MTPEHLVAALGVYAGTFVVGLVSSLVPFVSIDLFLIGVTLAAPSVAALPIIALAASGQLVGKLPIYFAVRGVTALPGRHRARVERVRAWAARWRSPHVILAASALLGLPPFSIVATAAGALAIRTRTFTAIVVGGRGLRFAAVVSVAAAMR